MKKVLLCLISISILSCDIKDKIISQVGDGTVKATINGQTKTWSFGPNSVGASITSSDTGVGIVYGFGLAANSDGVSDNSESTSIAITIIKDNPDFIVSGATFSYPEDLIEGFYTYENEDESNVIDGDVTSSATMTITSYDEANGRITGTFNFVTVDENTNIIYTVSNGSFTDIPFYIQ